MIKRNKNTRKLLQNSNILHAKMGEKLLFFLFSLFMFFSSFPSSDPFMFVVELGGGKIVEISIQSTTNEPAMVQKVKSINPRRGNL
jgi:hypothetical protein